MSTQKRSLYSLSFVLILVMLFSSCKEEPVDPDPFTIDFITQSQAFSVASNLANSSDPNALLTAAYVNSMQSIFVGYSSFFLVPGNAVNAGNRTWTWGDGAGNTISYKWTENNGENCVTVSLNGPQVANGTYYEICEKKDGTGGYMKIFDPENNGMLVFEILWTADASGAGTMTSIDYDSDTRQEVAWNADGSGTFKLFESASLIYQSNWNAVGAGSFIEYDTQGNIIDQGSWG